MSQNESAGFGWRTPVLVIIAGCLISIIGFGIRSTFGLFLDPMTIANGWTRETFAIAMAIQNLLWGIGVPIAGALSDKFGPAKVIAIGAVMYALGIFGMAISESSLMLHLCGGLLTGTGIAFTSFSIALAVMAKVVQPERRPLVLGIGTASGSLGQVLFSPLALGFIVNFGWVGALYTLAGAALVMIPLAFILPNLVTEKVADEPDQTLREALREALSYKSYVLLMTGFFVCGFHVSFITVHFPAYIKDLGFAIETGAIAIALIGLFNIIGAFSAGLAGTRYSKKWMLTGMYFLRAVAITMLLLSPTTELSIYIFSAFMGLLWLSTVPLTTGLVAQMFGVRYMATLFGIVFFAHQLGSFTGVWLGGWAYDHLGTYDPVWWAGVALAVLAAIVHIPIVEAPFDRSEPEFTVGPGGAAVLVARPAPGFSRFLPEIMITLGAGMLAISILGFVRTVL